MAVRYAFYSRNSEVSKFTWQTLELVVFQSPCILNKPFYFLQALNPHQSCCRQLVIACNVKAMPCSEMFPENLQGHLLRELVE